MTLYTETGHLPVTPPYDFAKSLDFLDHFPPMRSEQEITENSLTKAISIDGQCVAFRLNGGGTVEEPEIRYTLFSEKPLDAVKTAVTDRVSFFLSLTDDLKPFYKIGKTDPHFALMIDQLYGLHHVKFLTLCESACWAILTQYKAVPSARKMKRAIVERYGSSIEVDGRVYWAFPEFEQLIGVSPGEFATVIKDERRAEYLSGAVRSLSAMDEEFLRRGPYYEAEAALRSIKGIGAWSAAFILMRCEGRMEHMLFDLKAFLDALPKVYGPGETMEHLAERYGPWFGYWGFYFRVAT